MPLGVSERANGVCVWSVQGVLPAFDLWSRGHHHLAAHDY